MEGLLEHRSEVGAGCGQLHNHNVTGRRVREIYRASSGTVACGGHNANTTHTFLFQPHAQPLQFNQRSLTPQHSSFLFTFSLPEYLCFLYFLFPDHVFSAVSEQKKAVAVNTRLTESYSFPIVGSETEVGSAGCLNDSVLQPASLCFSRLGHTPAIYTHPKHGSAQHQPAFGAGARGDGLAFRLTSCHNARFGFWGHKTCDVRRFSCSLCTKSIRFVPKYVTNL